MVRKSCEGMFWITDDNTRCDVIHIITVLLSLQFHEFIISTGHRIIGSHYANRRKKLMEFNRCSLHFLLRFINYCLYHHNGQNTPLENHLIWLCSIW